MEEGLLFNEPGPTAALVAEWHRGHQGKESLAGGQRTFIGEVKDLRAAVRLQSRSGVRPLSQPFALGRGLGGHPVLRELIRRLRLSARSYTTTRRASITPSVALPSFSSFDFTLTRLTAPRSFRVLFLGHPAYYPRFGFVPAAAKGLRCEYPVPDEVFRAAELVPGALTGGTDLVKYRPEFAGV